MIILDRDGLFQRFNPLLELLQALRIVRAVIFGCYRCKIRPWLNSRHRCLTLQDSIHRAVGWLPPISAHPRRRLTHADILEPRAL